MDLGWNGSPWDVRWCWLSGERVIYWDAAGFMIWDASPVESSLRDSYGESDALAVALADLDQYRAWVPADCPNRVKRLRDVIVRGSPGHRAYRWDMQVHGTHVTVRIGSLRWDWTVEHIAKLLDARDVLASSQQLRLWD